MIKFSDTFYFSEWKQNPTIERGSSATWRKGGFDDDAICLEVTHITGINYDNVIYWEPYFSCYSKNIQQMTILGNLYYSLYPNLKFREFEIVKAKLHIDEFLFKVSQMKIFL
jgi:hypothetical protein